ncbi:MAG TPA: hypothetical protein VMT03_07590 [Polyangia bacterium]|nr:hypothetical protein [Polyangia bacterium]
MPHADDTEIAEALERARRGLSPGPGDLERVRRGLEAAFRAPVPRAPEAPPAPSAWRLLARRLALASALTGTGAAVGYWAGRRAERREIASTLPAAHATPIAAPAARTEAPPVEEPALPRQNTEAHRDERHRHADIVSPPKTDAESLAAEVHALRNTERALRERNPGLAAAFLDGLDREIPGGQLREERAALRAIARCAAGDSPFGVNLADEFAQAFPSSAYRGRVDQACERTDQRGAGDSAGRR